MDSRGDWPSGGRAQDAQPPEAQRGLSIKVAVVDTRSGRSGGYNLKGPLECTFYSSGQRLLRSCLGAARRALCCSSGSPQRAPRARGQPQDVEPLHYTRMYAFAAMNEIKSCSARPSQYTHCPPVRAGSCLAPPSSLPPGRVRLVLPGNQLPAPAHAPLAARAAFVSMGLQPLPAASDGAAVRRQCVGCSKAALGQTGTRWHEVPRTRRAQVTAVTGRTLRLFSRPGSRTRRRCGAALLIEPAVL
jgi:hypothetical protein